MENLRKVKRNSGITLVALVVTIIVLLILAGITIAMLTGENGIINRAFQAKEATEYAQIEEEVALAWTEVQAEKVIENLSQEETADYLEEVLKQNDPNTSVEYRDENDTYEVNYKDHMFEIQPNGELTHNREDAIKDIEEAWENADKNGTEEDIAGDMQEELQGKDPDSSSEYNPDSGKIDVDHGGYEVEVDPDTGEITIKDPIKVEKAEVNITGEPQDVEVFAGNTATFTVEAEATGEVTYQWYKNTSASTISGQAISGANSSSYTTPATTTADNGTYYYCEITSSLNGKTVKDKTVGAKLTVTTKVTIGEITNPEIIVEEGDTAEIEVPVTGGEGSDIKYQWYKNDENSNEGGEPIGDATSNPLEIPDVSKADDGYYYLEITQTVGDDEVVIKSDPIKVTVTEKVEPVQISAQPENAEALEGESASFSVEVTGEGEITYQWYKTTTGSTTNGTPIDGANEATYTIEEVTAQDNGTYYYCEITQKTPTKENKVTTDPAKLTVIEKVEITAQPQSQEAIEGQTATFEVEVTGEGNITYQWYKNGSPIDGANNSSYTTEALTPENSGDKYYCEITQEHNGQTTTITTQEAMLTVLNVNITANPTNVQLYVGGVSQEIQITGTNYGSLSLSGIDEQIAKAEITSENTITITPVGNGNTQLIVTESNANKTATVDITVSGTSIDPSVDDVTITYGGEAQLVTINGVNVGDIEVVTQPNSSVASVEISNKNIIITPVGAGETSITIKETNGNQEVTIPITIEKATPELSLSVNSGSVDYGATNSFTVTPNATPAINGTLQVTSGSPENVTIQSGNGASAINGAPTTVTYKGENATTEDVTITITFKPTDTQNYNEVSTSYTVTVNKIPATNPTLTAYQGAYDGYPHTIQVQGGSGGTIVYSTDQQQWSEELPTRTEQGVTTVYVKVQGDSNHTDSEVISSTITIDETSMSIESGDYKGAYDSLPHSITLNVTVPSSGIEIYYSTDTELNEENYSTAGTPTKPERTEAGETTVYWYVHSENSNYTDRSGSNKITIDRATTGEGGAPLVTFEQVTGPEGAALTYNGEVQTGVTGQNVEITGDMQATDAGTYTAYATPTSNYAWSDGTTSQREIEWSIAQKQVAVVWEVTELQYNKESQKPVASVSTGVDRETINLNITTNEEAINIGDYTAQAAIDSVTGGQGRVDNYILTNTTTDFKIIAKQVKPDNPTSTVTAELTQQSVTYTGSVRTPDIIVRDGETRLIKDQDYKVEYKDNINVGTGKAIITLQGNYAGTINLEFAITKMQIAVPTAVEGLTYNTQEQTGVIQGSYYTLTNNTAKDAGNYIATASLTDTANTEWQDSTIENKQINWAIASKQISDDNNTDLEVTLDKTNFTYDGTEKKPTPTVREISTGATLQEGTDYDVSYRDNQNEGTGKVVITLKKNYSGEITKDFTIEARGMEITSNNYSGTYDAQPHSIEVVVTTPSTGTTIYYSDTTELNQDNYSTEGSTNNPTRTDVGETTIYWYVHSSDTNYNDKSGSNTITITKQNITIPKAIEGLIYNGQVQTGVAQGEGYNLTNNTGTDAKGYTATATLTDTNNTQWQDQTTDPKEIAWQITAKASTGTNTTATLSQESYVYDGTEKKPTVTVRDEELAKDLQDTDYEVTYSSNQNVGQAQAIINLKGNYSGQIIKEFTITKKQITVPTAITGLIYNGNLQTGVPTGEGYTLTNNTGTDATTYQAIATLTDTNNTEWQDGTITEKTIPWEIAVKQIPEGEQNTDIEVSLSQNTYTYDGQEKRPVPTVKDVVINKTLEVDTDYEVAYSANQNAGQAQVIITLEGNYAGTVTTNFTINKMQIAVPTAIPNLVYNGQVQTGVAQGDGYSLTNNTGTNATTYQATAILTDTNNTEWTDQTTDAKQIAWQIAAKPVTEESADIEVHLSQNNYTYDGTQKMPGVTVKDTSTGATLAQDSDFTVEYGENTNVGNGTVTIKFQNNYSGEIVEQFTIEEGGMEVTAQDYTGTYDGAPHTITLNVTNPLGTTIYYSTTEELNDTNYNTAGTEAKPEVTNAGETTVYWYILSNNTNYSNKAGSNKITITKAQGTATVTITGQNKVGETLTAEVSTESDGTKSYQWWYADTASANSGTSIPNANSETYQIDGTYAGSYIGCTVTIEEGTNYTACSANDITDSQNNGVDTAWQIPQISITPNTFETALGNNIILTAEPTGTYDSVEYQWYYNTENTAGTGTAGATTSTYTFTPTATGTYYVSVVATYTYGQATAEVTSTVSTITIQEAYYSIAKEGVTTYYNNLALAVTGAIAGDTIKVEKDVTDSSITNIDKAITLDTGSYTISTANTITVSSAGTLTIAGQGAIQSTATNVIANSGTVNIGNSTDVLNITAPEIRGESYGIYNNAGTLNFNNGILKGKTAGYYGDTVIPRTGHNIQTGTDGEYQTAYLVELPHATVGEEAEEETTINGQEGSYQNPTIPAGYIPVNTETAVWDDPAGPEWNNGLVITDAQTNGNEWVWVPVQDPSIMYEESSTPIALSGSTGVTTTRYSKSNIISGITRGISGSTDYTYYREPDILTGSDFDDTYYGTAGFNTLQEMAQSIANEYNTMILSIEKYGGFYIGRYELTANGLKSGATLTNINWYEAYIGCRNLGKVGSDTISSMIWGAQWDVTCLWLSESGYNITDASAWGNYSNSTENAAVSGYGRKQNTGYSEYWKANNIYDLAGNCYEWTQDGKVQTRDIRGGYYSLNGSYAPGNFRGTLSWASGKADSMTTRPTLILSPYDDLPEGLEVGSTVSYNPSGTYNVEAQYSGHSTNQTLNSSSGQSYNLNTWKVLNIQEGTNQVELVPVAPTSGTLTLRGANGYNNAVKLLNEACNSLYGNISKGITARSLNRDDLEDYMTEGTLSTAHSGNYGIRPYTYTNRYYPSIYGSEANRTIDGTTVVSGLGISMQSSFVTGSTRASSSISPMTTSYTLSGLSTASFKTASNGTNYYNLLYPNTTYRWLASRNISTNGSSLCGFNICIAYSNIINSRAMFGSNGLTDGDSYALFPVVSLSIDQISGNSSSGFSVQ